VEVFSNGKVCVFFAIIPCRYVLAMSARAQRSTAGNVTYVPAQTIAPLVPNVSPLRMPNVLSARDVKDKGRGNPVNRLQLLGTDHANLRLA
jgi:hypothetical protein